MALDPRGSDWANSVQSFKDTRVAVPEIEVKDALVVGDSITKLANLIQSSMGFAMPQPPVWKSFMEVWNPQRVAVGSSRKGAPEAERQFSDNSAGQDALFP